MRELTIRIRFTVPCLGNVKLRDGSGRFVLPRTPDESHVMFLASWHNANMRFASELLGRHQDEVQKIGWDIAIDGVVRRRWERRYYTNPSGVQRYAKHEAFFAGQTIGLNCAVPRTISDDDLLQLMNLAGQYRGLSPWRPGEYGLFEVVSITGRRRTAPPADVQTTQTEARSNVHAP
jgi:hypothetical protein